MSDAETRSWPREQLDQSARKAIRECADDILVVKQDDDDAKVASLKPGGDTVLLDAVYKAIDQAGWQLLPKA
jgi:hypothetical protein